MRKVGYRCPFCPKVRFTRCCPALRFLAKITCAHHVFAQFSCTRARLAVHEQGRVPMPVLPESPFYTMLLRAAYFGQNRMRAPCFRPVFMYMSKVSCTSARSGTDARFARKSVLHDVAPRCVFLPKSHARTMFSPSFHVHEQGRVPMPVLPESRDRAFFLDLGIWYLFIRHHSHMTIRHETQTLLHDCISHDRAFFHDLGFCYLFNSHHWGLDISLVHDLGKSQ